MKRLKLVLSLAALPAFFFWASFATAQQALPTASRTLQLSAFGGLSGDYIGLSGGKNLGITAGVDLGLIPYHGVRPTVEVRGTFPIDDGHIASQKSILFGPRFDFLLNRRLRPYGDFLFGRGEMDYNNGGYIIGNEIFLLTTTNVWAVGGGFDYDLTHSFSLKVDGQFEHWGQSPTPSGSVYSKVGTVALVYRFNFDHRHR
jgi:hypothetical protein